MVKLVIASKTGFKANTPKVLIFDENNKVFYNYSPKGGLLNLPPGTYFSESILLPLKSPLTFKLPLLPKKQKRSNLEISEFKIRIAPNPGKASIYLNSGIIEIDPVFWSNLSKAQKDYVLSHEFGHLHYEDEKSADLYAACQMLKIGYNPSQIAHVVLNTFSANKENVARCENVINNLIKTPPKTIPLKGEFKI